MEGAKAPTKRKEVFSPKAPRVKRPTKVPIQKKEKKGLEKIGVRNPKIFPRRGRTKAKFLKRGPPRFSSLGVDFGEEHYYFLPYFPILFFAFFFYFFFFQKTKIWRGGGTGAQEIFIFCKTQGVFFFLGLFLGKRQKSVLGLKIFFFGEGGGGSIERFFKIFFNGSKTKKTKIFSPFIWVLIRFSFY